MNRLPSSPTWDPTTRTLRLSGSSLSSWQRCPYRWWVSHILGRVKAGPVSIPALFGQAVHCGLSRLALGNDLATAKAAVTLTYAGVELPQEEWMTSGRAAATLEAYHHQWLADAWKPVMAGEQPVVEHPFCFFLGSVGGAQVHWSGYVDLAVEAEVAGRKQRVVVDHKTTQRSSDLNLLRARYEMSRSLLGYVVAMETLGLGEFDGILANEIIVRKPTHKTTAATKPPFECGEGHRLFIPFSDSKKGRWRSEVLDLAERILHQLDSGTFPRYETACAFPSICQYHEACTMDSEEDCLSFLQSEEYVTKQPRPELVVADPAEI
jgi:hypothetical protein